MKTSQYSGRQESRPLCLHHTLSSISHILFRYWLLALCGLQQHPQIKCFRCPKWTCNHNTSITLDIRSSLSITGIWLCIYFQSHIPVMLRGDLMSSGIEVLVVAGSLGTSKAFLLGCFCRLPSTNSQYLRKLFRHLDMLRYRLTLKKTIPYIQYPIMAKQKQVFRNVC